MSILKNKIKKVNKLKRFFYFLTSLLYILSTGYFVFALLHLASIETVLRIIVIIIAILWAIIYLFIALIAMLAKKTKTFVVLTVLTLILCPIYDVGGYYINKVYGSLSMMNKDTVTYTTNLIALNSTTFNTSSKIGMIETENDIEGHELAVALIHKKNMTNKVVYYEDYGTMIRALYDGKIDACFVTSNYAITFANETFTEDPNETPLADRVKVIDEYSEDRKNQDTETISDTSISKITKKIDEPFTMLIMGVDSENDGLKANQAFNGDTLIMVTFNPKTLTATMFSIPRDMYVPIACNGNKYAKINSSAAYGSSCVINTVQNLTGITVDYYLKMNFKGVVDLVDALGGVTVDVEEPDFNINAGVDCKGMVCEQNSLRHFGNEMVYVPTGVQTINGEQALAYARNRHQYAISDIARNQHQQDIIEAIAQKAKTLRSVKDFENLLDAVSRNLETNMTPEQIMSFYNVFKDVVLNSNSDSFSIKKTYLAYYSLTVYRGYNASCLGYYQSSLDAITKLMRQNLGKEKVTPVKTFDISYNEDYETPLVGYGLTSGTKLETLPSFITYDKDYVNGWCHEHSLDCKFESRASAEDKGFILEQSEYQHTLLKAIKSVTFIYSDGSLKQGATGTTPTPDSNSNKLKNYIGYDKDYVNEKFCDLNPDIKCKFNEIEGDGKTEAGEITKQSQSAGTDLDSISSITFTYSDGKGYKKPETPSTPSNPGTSSTPGTPSEPEIPGAPTGQKPSQDETPSAENQADGTGDTQE